MQFDQFFHWAGQKLGELLRLIVDALSYIFGHLYAWIDSFFHGLTQALGVDPSWFSLVMLVLGLVLLYAAFKALLRQHIVATIIWLVLGLVVLSWLIE